MNGSIIGGVTYGPVEQTVRDFNNPNFTLSDCLGRFYPREEKFKRIIGKIIDDGREI